MTGFFATRRGSSLRKASLIARWTRGPSNSARGAFLGRTTWVIDGVGAGTAMGFCCVWVVMAPLSVGGEVEHLEMLDDGPERESGEIGEGSDDEHDADEQRREGRRIGRKGARRSCDLALLGQGTGHRQERDDHQKAPDQHRESDGGVVPGCVRGDAGESGAVVPGAGGVRVEDLAETVGSGVVQVARRRSVHRIAAAVGAIRPAMNTAKTANISMP